jgi:twitching motility protein PilT
MTAYNTSPDKSISFGASKEDTDFLCPDSISLLNDDNSTGFMLPEDLPALEPFMSSLEIAERQSASNHTSENIYKQVVPRIPQRLTQQIKPISVRPEPKLSEGHPTINGLVLEAFDNGYSDLHLGVGESPRFRNRGEIIKSNHPVTDELTFMNWLHEILTPDEFVLFEETLDLDTAVQYENVRVRVNVFGSLYGYSMVLRLIPMQIAGIDELKLPFVFKDISAAKKGLVLITGPTGSGKSTSMAAMIDYINKEMPRHIVTIEDPVEFIHKSKQSLIKHREVGKNTKEFGRALKAVLREDPDVILIGEIRDAVTAEIAMKAAQTGHLVIGTLHTNSAVKTIERFLTLFKAEEIPTARIALSESLVAVISQGLCQTTDGKRAAYHDIMVVTETIKDYIMKNEYEQIELLMKDGEMSGMITTNQSIYKLYEEGRITEDTALELSSPENEMSIMLRGGHHK